MADRPHDRRLRFVPLSFVEKNILENNLFHHGLIRGSLDMEWSLVMPPIVLEVSRSQDSSMMGFF